MSISWRQVFNGHRYQKDFITNVDQSDWHRKSKTFKLHQSKIKKRRRKIRLKERVLQEASPIVWAHNEVDKVETKQQSDSLL